MIDHERSSWLFPHSFFSEVRKVCTNDDDVEAAAADKKDRVAEAKITSSMIPKSSSLWGKRKPRCFYFSMRRKVSKQSIVDSSHDNNGNICGMFRPPWTPSIHDYRAASYITSGIVIPVSGALIAQVTFAPKKVHCVGGYFINNILVIASRGTHWAVFFDLTASAV